MPKKSTIKTEKSVTKTNDITVAQVSLSGKAADYAVSNDVLAEAVNVPLIAQAVRVYRSALRQGTAATKTRGFVVGSTRKIYRQKGTGRARHGSVKAPVFVGGGTVFGPLPREFRLDLPMKMRKQALHQIFTQKVKENEILLVNDFANASGKTKEMNDFLKKNELAGKKVLVVIDSAMDKALLGLRNIESVLVRKVDVISFYDFAQFSHIVIATEAFEKLAQKMKS